MITMQEHMQSRLAELQHEYQRGQGQLHELIQQEAVLRKTLLRISGAIQVLEEMLAQGQATGDSQETAPQVLHVP
jgi:hypothetical protein